ncbi:Anaphase-promoting complex subunit 23, partial [Quaeritorhiza haematococci]
SITPNLQNTFMKKFFVVVTSLELHSNVELVQSLIPQLSDLFPKSSFVKAQRALAVYNVREFEEAEEIFDEIIRDDPYVLDHMDVYSNVLYVMEKKAKLSYLAHNSCLTDKYRPETCCIVGNYYSLRADHAKAVLYFQRAIRLNRNYLSAWTLMGHEYVEMKNTHAAIEAYRRAIDINPRDYRAWYGLGQTYEVLRMPYYSLYYYQRATSLRPYDARMWCALAGCYETLDRTVEAIRCYKRALLGGENEAVALGKLARLYAKMENSDTAAYYYRLTLIEHKNRGNVQSPDVEEACLYLSQYHKERNQFEEADQYIAEIAHTEEGKALMRELRSVRGSLGGIMDT